MQIYHYDDNGFFTAETKAINKDELESVLQGHDVWVIPAFATTIAPPDNVPEGKIAYFDYTDFPQEWKMMDVAVLPDPVDPPDNQAPPAPPIPAISKRQFWQQIALLGWISFQEAIDFMQTGKLPDQIEQAILSLNEDPNGILQFKARMAFMANEYNRNNTFVDMIGALLGKNEEEIDGLFLGAANTD